MPQADQSTRARPELPSNINIMIRSEPARDDRERVEARGRVHHHHHAHRRIRLQRRRYHGMRLT